MKSRAMVWMAGVLVLVGCTGSRPVSQRPGLLSTRWVQTSAEYTALALQAYEMARRQLVQALADSTWTAYPAQADAPDLARRPPAVIVDVDETVLDNSPYQAWLVTTGRTFSPESWARWVQGRAGRTCARCCRVRTGGAPARRPGLLCDKPHVRPGGGHPS